MAKTKTQVPSAVSIQTVDQECREPKISLMQVTGSSTLRRCALMLHPNIENVQTVQCLLEWRPTAVPTVEGRLARQSRALVSVHVDTGVLSQTVHTVHAFGYTSRVRSQFSLQDVPQREHGDSLQQVWALQAGWL